MEARSVDRQAVDTGGTPERLVETVLELSRDRPIDQVKVEQVLATSDISTGSLYHHFEDFPHLIETAMAERYVEILRAGLILVGSALDEALDIDDLKSRILEASLAYSEMNTPELRFERARILARAGQSERLRGMLSAVQQELTDSLTAMFARSQGPDGWLDPDLDPKSLAVFIQAYTFGRLVDDIVPEPMEQAAWQDLTLTVFMRALVEGPPVR